MEREFQSFKRVYEMWNKGLQVIAFTIPIDDVGAVRRNAYQATAVVRIKEDKLYLYDIINIKKASTPL